LLARWLNQAQEKTSQQAVKALREVVVEPFLPPFYKLSSANVGAMPLPIPRELPVTSAYFPFSVTSTLPLEAHFSSESGSRGYTGWRIFGVLSNRMERMVDTGEFGCLASTVSRLA
jgi:hypothetical protein